MNPRVRSGIFIFQHVYKVQTGKLLCYNYPMNNTSSLYWEAPEHNHIEKSHDWFWALAIIAIAGSITSIIFGNVLFGVVILLATMVIFLNGNKLPHIIPFEILTRGIRVGDELYPYSTLESYYIDEHNPQGPQLIIKSKKLLMPLIIIPLPDEYVDDAEHLIAPRLPEEHLEEPFAHKLMEYFGF